MNWRLVFFSALLGAVVVAWLAGYPLLGAGLGFGWLLHSFADIAVMVSRQPVYRPGDDRRWISRGKSPFVP